MSVLVTQNHLCQVVCESFCHSFILPHISIYLTPYPFDASSCLFFAWCPPPRVWPSSKKTLFMSHTLGHTNALFPHHIQFWYFIRNTNEYVRKSNILNFYHTFVIYLVSFWRSVLHLHSTKLLKATVQGKMIGMRILIEDLLHWVMW